MIFQRRPFSFLLTIIILSFLITLGNASRIVAASPRLSNVTQEMERPGYWIKKIKNPTQILFTAAAIEKMNEENLKRQDLHLSRIKNLKEDWTREEVLHLLKEDWKNFGKTQEPYYGKNGIPLGESFWNELKIKLSEDSIQKNSRMLYALIVKRTDIRVFPTDEPSMSSPHRYEFDRFQHSSISPGSPIGIYHFSKDKGWAYVQTCFIRGWVRSYDLAIAREKKEVIDYEEAKDRLMVTGNFINIFDDPSFRQSGFVAQMGDSFPLLSVPGNTAKTNPCYLISIPSREDNGYLTLKRGYIRSSEDVQRGVLPYTQENIARQAFKMLNHPYGWGDRAGGRDCSRFIMDLFRTFGILMPRNSKDQAMVGNDLGLVDGKTIKEKQRVLDQAIPLATTLQSPGHIMLYLGKDKGRYYVIHSIWGIQKSGRSGLLLEKIGRVAVSDLSDGKPESNGSLFHRLTDVRFIGTP
jgi:SH3 domain (SH3b1 type)/NlpC/P60 family